MSHWEVLKPIIEKGDPVSPIFSIPFLDTKSFKIDWLHVADQGVSANFLGSLLPVLVISYYILYIIYFADIKVF